MSFQSLEFLYLFLPLYLVYWFLNLKWQNLFLLVASIIFYWSNGPWLLGLIAVPIFINYAAGWLIYEKKMPKTILVTSAVLTFSILAYYKYYDYFAGALNCFLPSNLHLPSFYIILPVGISFFTFQAFSYTYDVYRNDTKVEKNPALFGLFILFFPQLVAGPIERAHDLLTQLRNQRKYRFDDFSEGMCLLSWGYVQKLVIADNLAIIVSKVMNIGEPNFYLLWSGIFAFCFQIYADFSGYTDMARGLAKLLGINLLQNFNAPYLAKSMTEFWRRWHISLSTWFKDYVYIPLGGNKKGSLRTDINLFITFTLSGLWHGSRFNFVLWGMFHGILLVIHRRWSKLKVPFRGTLTYTFLSWLLVFILTNIGWMLFRETRFAYIVKYLKLSPFDLDFSTLVAAAFNINIAIIYSTPIWIFMLLKYYRISHPIFEVKSFKLGLGLALIVTAFFLQAEGKESFIYFQF